MPPRRGAVCGRPPLYGGRREPTTYTTYTIPSPSLTPPRTPARRARGGRPTEVDGFDEPLHPVGCEIGTIIQGLTVRAPSKGRVAPHCHPLVAAVSCLISKTGGSSLVRSASCGEWPAQHAEVRWKIKYLYNKSCQRLRVQQVIHTSNREPLLEFVGHSSAMDFVYS